MRAAKGKKPLLCRIFGHKKVKIELAMAIHHKCRRKGCTWQRVRVTG